MQSEAPKRRMDRSGIPTQENTVAAAMAAENNLGIRSMPLSRARRQARPAGSSLWVWRRHGGWCSGKPSICSTLKTV